MLDSSKCEYSNEYVFVIEKTIDIRIPKTGKERTREYILEGLYIVPENNVKRVYHRLIQPHHKTDLQSELERLRYNHYETIVDVIADFISKTKGLSLFSFNCQSLRSHVNDLNDQVAQRSNILILSETWFDNEQEQSIPNFNCIVK